MVSRRARGSAVTAQLGTAILDDRGYPDEHPIRFELYRTRVFYEMDWCRLTCTASARDLADPATERAWLEFLRTAADMANPSFGHVDYLYESAGQTPTEGTVGQPWLTDYEADSTSRQFLRGYGWLTVLAQELADRLGGAQALRRTGAFHEVEPLAAGGVWCLATERFRDFDEEALLRVFLAVAPVLRPGTPRTWPLRGDFPPRIVYRDAADPGNPTPPEPVSIAVPVNSLVPGWAEGKAFLPPAPN